MKRTIHDNGRVIAVRSQADDAAARLRLLSDAILARIAKRQPVILTAEERDLLLIAVAQKFGILAPSPARAENVQADAASEALGIATADSGHF